MPEYSILGKRLPRIDALDKATGKALYSADITLPNMLYGKVLRSPCAHAIIRRLDISRAQALKGVKAIITAADIPKNKAFDPSIVPYLAKGKSLFVGHAVAVVAAINTDIAEKALGLIEIDYEELPPVLDVLEAMKPNAPLIHPDMFTNLMVPGQPGKATVPSNIAWQVEIENGDVTAGFKEADIILENTYCTQRVHQGYLEPRAAVASVDSNGKVTIWTDNQGLFQAQELCAEFLNVPVSHVKVMPIEVGGAFGGKQSQPLSPLCALLARKTGHPVKMVMTREEDLIAGCPAPESRITLKMGVDKAGHITAASLKLILDIGALNRQVYDSMGSTMLGLSLYRIPHLNINIYNVVTNKAPTGMYRAPDGPDAAFAVESQMDLLARALQVDPIDFRLMNAVSEGDRAADGSRFPRIGFKETLQKMKEYVNNRNKPEMKNRGIGIACGLWKGGGGAFSASVNVIADGSVALLVGSCDITGTRTSLAQIVAEEFGIDLDQVTVTTGDTDTASYAGVSSGSRTIRQMSTAVHIACQDARNQLILQAASKLGVKPNEVQFADGQIRMVGNPEKFLLLKDLARDAIGWGGKGKGPIIGRGAVNSNQPAPMFAVQMAEVEVNKETGKVKVLAYAAAQDVGFAINPTLIEGQIQGAVTQGIGRALMEEYKFQDGIMQNTNFLDYRVPTAVDVPFKEVLLVEVKSDIEPFGVRGVGEPPMIPTLAAIANAIHSATGVRLKDLPMTPEIVYKAMQTK